VLAQGQPLPDIPADWQDTGAAAVAALPTATAQPAAAVASSAETEMPLNLEVDDVEMLREFISESYEHLHNIELGVLVLEEKPEDHDTLNSIFRAFHTFKGGSGLLNLTPVNRLAHELESLLDLARHKKIGISSQVIDVILEGGDVLKRFTVEIERQVSGERDNSAIIIPTSELIARVRRIVQQGVPPASAPEQAAPAPEAPAQASPVQSPVSVSKEPAPAPAAPVVVPSAAEEHKSESKDPSKESAARAAGTDAAMGSASALVKVATQKLDNLVDLTGEMVIAQSQVVHDPSLTGMADVRLLRNLTQLSRIANELQKTVLSLRMVPIRPTFQKMNRLIRDLATRQGKLIELKLHGEDTELDRTLVEQLNDPLVHMIRNAVDHGIEKDVVRRANGKPPVGTIDLRAWHQGGSIILEVKDDGAGLNCDRIRAKAIKEGLIHADTVLTEQETYQLIFEPGFSTAEIVTDVSGRGVGMDVVRRNIEKLRGKIEIQSVLGEGSCFRIYLPLTLAIIDGMLISIGHQRYILPALLVRESFRPTPGMISTVQGKGEMVNVRGRLTPMLRLYEHFGLTPESTDPTQSVVVVVGYENQQRCLLVDQLLGKQEVVIKALGETFKQRKDFAGAAILGDGQVGLIIEVDGLVNLKGDSTKRAA
jgi:two-component system chemotaxis sensor kinase CheA